MAALHSKLLPSLSVHGWLADSTGLIEGNTSLVKAFTLSQQALFDVCRDGLISSGSPLVKALPLSEQALFNAIQGWSRYLVAALQSKLLPSGVGGALLGSYTGRVQFINSNITSNNAQLSGGGIHLEQSVLSMEGCWLQDNTVRGPWGV